jgi:hypothetical protein
MSNEALIPLGLFLSSAEYWNCLVSAAETGDNPIVSVKNKAAAIARALLKTLVIINPHVLSVLTAGRIFIYLGLTPHFRGKMRFASII